MKALAQWCGSFWRFWVDFLLGDAPVLLPATLLIVAVALALRHHGIIAVVIVPLLVVVLVGAVAFFGRQRAGHSAASQPEASQRD